MLRVYCASSVGMLAITGAATGGADSIPEFATLMVFSTLGASQAIKDSGLPHHEILPRLGLTLMPFIFRQGGRLP